MEGVNTPNWVRWPRSADGGCDGHIDCILVGLGSIGVDMCAAANSGCPALHTPSIADAGMASGIVAGMPWGTEEGTASAEGSGTRHAPPPMPSDTFRGDPVPSLLATQ